MKVLDFFICIVEDFYKLNVWNMIDSILVLVLYINWFMWINVC